MRRGDEGREEPGVLLEDLKPPAASVLELEADGTAVRRETSAVVSDQRLNITFEFQLTHATGATDRFTELHSMLLLARDELERTLQSLGLCLEPARVSTTNQFRFKCTRA